MTTPYTIEEAERLACERAGVSYRDYSDDILSVTTDKLVRAFAEHIQKYEQKPVDPMYSAVVNAVANAAEGDFAVDADFFKRLIPELRSRNIDYVGEGK